MHELTEAFQNDESNLMYRFNPETGLLGQRQIHNDEEHVAHQHGYRDSHESALKVHNIIRSKFKPGAWVQNQGGKWVVVHPFGKKDDVAESASAGATSSASIATVVNPGQAYSNGPVKSVSALDQDKVSLFGGPMEDIKPRKKVAIIKRR